MATQPVPIQWSAQLALSTSQRSSRLPGDKIVLPAAALEQLLSASAKAEEASAGPAPAYDPWNAREYNSYRNNLEERQQKLPQPLTFRLVNPENGIIVYAGIQEFSAEDDEIIISPFLSSALGLKQGLAPHDGDALPEARVTVHYSQLQKGSYVKLRPLEAGYDVEDWKALLERYLRSNFTTLTRGQVLEVPGGSTLGQSATFFRFLVDEFKPKGDAICVVDTDLEVDIEALNEEQARETVKKIAAKYQNGASSGTGSSSSGGDLDIFNEYSGQILPGDYVDYQLASWPRDQTIEIRLEQDPDAESLDLLISPFSPRQRAKPRADDYVFANWDDGGVKQINIAPTNIELEDAEALYISVYAFQPSQTGDNDARSGTTKFTIRARVKDSTTPADRADTSAIPEMKSPNEGDVRCKNCGQWVPQRTLVLHENFCFRNNIVCPHGCGQVFQKQSDAFHRHWHCPHDTFHGNSSLSHLKHDSLYHPSEPLHCSRCPSIQTFSSVPLLAQHHTSTCPAKLILCRFCHLAVPQEGDPDEPNPEALLSGLTVHELADGSRTTECHLCGKITRMRDMNTHMAHHNLERKSRPRPRVCRNVNCGNTLDGASHSGSTRAGKAPDNDVGLCNACFGPLYVSMYDPEGKALKRRIERRYLQQLMTGCGKDWCLNAFCRSGRSHAGMPEEGTSAKTAIPLVKPFVDATTSNLDSPLHFCVDEAGARRRERALMLESDAQNHLGQRGYDFAWCLAACEAEGGDLEKARTWLENYAPRRDEERGV